MSEQNELRKSISTYIDRYPSANKSENEENLRELRRLQSLGDSESLKKAKVIRDNIVLSNGGFAMKYVMKYSAVLNEEVSMTDLFQEATLGIIEAVDAFDLGLKTAFTTYAYFQVKKRLIDFIKRNKLVKAPRDIARNLKHVNEIRNELLSENRTEPNSQEIKATLFRRKGITLSDTMIDNIVILLDLNSSSQSDSFISEFKEQACSESESDLFKMMEICLLKQIEKLTEQQQEIIKLRFGIDKSYPHTVEEIKYMLNLEDLDKINP